MTIMASLHHVYFLSPMIPITVNVFFIHKRTFLFKNLGIFISKKKKINIFNIKLLISILQGFFYQKILIILYSYKMSRLIFINNCLIFFKIFKYT